MAIPCPAGVFARFKVIEPAHGRFHVSASGFRHEDPWWLPTATVQTDAGAWTEWMDVSAWPWHGKLNRVGGIAEWPAMKLAVTPAIDANPVKGCTLEVQLAEQPEEKAVVHSFTEKSGSNTIAFLVPTPLREQAKEFETGSQMTARHLKWAKEAGGATPASLKHFTFVTALWGHYDPDLMRQAVKTLKLLGINVIGNGDSAILREMGVRTYGQTWSYAPDPEAAKQAWESEAKALKPAMDTEAGRWRTTGATHWVVGDEVMTLDFRGMTPAALNGWFRDYLRSKGLNDSDLGRALDQVEYPAKAMYEKSLPRDADLPTRKLMYHAAKFGHWYSAKRLRATSDLVRSTLPGMKTETLPSDHGFFHAWGAPHIGMSYRMLDLFELGAQRVVDEISAEDWLGLNHMYGPEYTWTGAQSFSYFNAICRSAMLHAPAEEPMTLRSLITPSDDAYLRLKAYSAIGQGSKSFFFWTFGPTYIGTENYWSDLRSEYDGIAKLSRAVQQAEHVLHPAKVVRDPVAILYSVSHDLWHTENAAAFVEKRLLWHALRHEHVQPDFLREEDVEAGRLKEYKVLYVTDWCLTRAASARIDEWVKAGGVVHLSAGAATRDEHYEPYVPPYAATVWPADAATQLKAEVHAYNERVDLPTIKSLDRATVDVLGLTPFELPVLGCRLALRGDVREPFVDFSDGTPAGAVVEHGGGRVIATGFLPMLAYGQGANFKPTTLEEHWPTEPRRLIQLSLDAAGVSPVAQCDKPVVETSLLTGPAGSALVLVNYTYHPIDALTVDVELSQPVTRATSTEGVAVHMEQTTNGIRLHLPLAWTEIILLE